MTGTMGKAKRAVHLVVVRRPYAERILDGAKVVEARLLKQRRAPYERVNTGDRLYFKVSGGPVVATAVVDAVRTYEHLTPKDIVALEREYDESVCGGTMFWASRRTAKYAVMVSFTKVKLAFFGPDDSVLGLGARRSGWRVLPAALDVYPQCLRQPREHIRRLKSTG